MNNESKNMNDSRRKLSMDRSVAGRIGTTLPKLDVPIQAGPPEHLLRDSLKMPELSESEIVRYFTQISTFNFSIDHNFYPLGSCTMKYNPKVNDDIAALPGFSEIHPLQEESTVQGALKLMHHLQDILAEIAGMAGTSLAPMAGAEGELAGMLMTRAYHQDNGNKNRTKILVPDSAHGTNPASAVMAGFEVISLNTDANGNTDIDALKYVLSEDIAGFMLTQPSTLGLFDTNVLDVVNMVRDVGGIIYGDGANLNALLGKVKPGQLGFDILHSNLHKTFTQPHGGGGPGAGAIMVSERMLPFLPTPLIDCQTDKSNNEFFTFVSPEKTIGKMGAFHGNFGALVRAYAYIRILGKQGLPKVSEDAVINANYIRSQLKEVFDLPYDRTCMHEVVFSARNLKRDNGITALDVSKRLIDYGIHPPTMYFPLIVEEALMIEPTETESKETIDEFIDIMKRIAQEAADDPSLLKNAPHNTPNTRLDEALAARKPDLRWN